MKDELKSRSQESGVRSQNDKAAIRFDRFCFSFLLASEFWILTPALLHHLAYGT
jgi:hypothetical protein